MAKRKKTITAGRLVKTILYTAPEPRDTERARAEKSHITAAAQQRMNDKAALERQTRERAEALEISKKMKTMKITVLAKGGGAGRLFGSVTNQEIADALKAQAGITLDKRKIVIDEPIKNVGLYTVRCKLGYEITGELTVQIEETK